LLGKEDVSLSAVLDTIKRRFHNWTAQFSRRAGCCLSLKGYKRKKSRVARTVLAGGLGGKRRCQSLY